MKRKIISIDDMKCTGCGQCIPDCPEGALQLIDGKARLVSDLFCDGLGACIGTCPEGAISVIEREAEPYDERRVMEVIVKQGAAVIKAHLEHLAGHGETALYNEAIEYLIEYGTPIPEHKPPAAKKPAPFGTRSTRAAPAAVCHAGPHEPNPFIGCPGAAAQSISREAPRTGPGQPVAGASSSELRQWPVQLALLNPAAAYFKNADLLVAADCTPFAFAQFHEEFLKGRILIIFCPKLDADIEGYIDKLAAIFSMHAIKSVMVLRMEVPCCGGVRHVVEKAMEKAGKKIPLQEKIVTIDGTIR
ncbi:4Fe-4S binding protein [Methanoregula sp.]|uniref:ATP-binding protein n=1 Tax=Methanoregula sp. TaxID=2052170 RepID=UPI00262D8D6D|nr:4Fe-4S binding protein [Methanoregula sp.]MDD5141850.1 4Fe-4S binding protein [Methanoregula sp.]